MLVLVRLLLLAVFCMVATVGARDIDNLHHFASTQQKVFKQLEQALIQDEVNLYFLKGMFFYTPNTDPVLFKVNYKITFGDNITENLPPLCNRMNRYTMISITQTEVTYGWTSSGVYYVVSPLVLNKMQMPLPFMILRMIHSLSKNSPYNSPELDSFLWDGSYDLPTIFLNLNVTSLPCIPSKIDFDATLSELTANLRAYAVHQGQISNKMSSEEIGFVLGMDHLFHNLSSSYIMWVWGANILFILIIVLFNMYYSKDFNNAVTKILDDRTEVVTAVLIIGMLLILAETVATAVQLYDDSGADYLLAKMAFYYISYPIIMFIVMIIGLFVAFILSFIVIVFRWKFKGSAVIFISRKLLVYTFSGLFLAYLCYYALPTFLFLLVYPTKVIVVATYFISYIFFVTLLTAVSIDVSKIIILEHKICGSNHKTSKVFLLIYLFFFFTYPVLSFAIMFLFLYLLVLGRASTITTTPSTFLSLLPTVAISAVSWILRKKFMNTNDTESNTDTDPTADLETESISQSTAARVDEDNPNHSTNEEENRDKNDNTQSETAGHATGDTETISHGESGTVDSEQRPLVSAI